MSRTSFLFFSLLLSLSASAFDGDVVMEMISRGQTVESKYTAKGDRMKVVMPDNQGSMILDVTKNQVIILMDDQKMYLVQPMNAAKISQTAGKITDTGETAEILGLKARKLEFVESDGKTSEIWATSDLKNKALNNMPGLNDQMIAQIEEIFGSKEVFPLKMTVKNADGSPEITMSVKEIIKRDVPASEVSIPSDYSEYKMPAAPSAPGQ